MTVENKVKQEVDGIVFQIIVYLFLFMLLSKNIFEQI